MVADHCQFLQDGILLRAGVPAHRSEAGLLGLAVIILMFTNVDDVFFIMIYNDVMVLRGRNLTDILRLDILEI